ncbi:MAG TPA: C40 family peptidase [Gaiellaceae bacterium]|nr:C40 family peptidase [Gaiellaceae bacterium]
MRPIRLLILLPVVALALAFGLVRPVQGRAGSVRTAAAGHGGAPPLPTRRRHLSFEPLDAAEGFGRRVAAYARRLLGIPYRWGGVSPRTGFDCSGLVRFVYAHFGLVLPHSSFADLAFGRRVARSALEPGDLVFFAGASHVGIYLGGGRFVDAPHAGAVVRISSLRGWYGATYYAARRLR